MNLSNSASFYHFFLHKFWNLLFIKCIYAMYLLFVFKSILCSITVDKSALFWLVFCWYIRFHLIQLLYFLMLLFGRSKIHQAHHIKKIMFWLTGSNSIWLIIFLIQSKPVYLFLYKSLYLLLYKWASILITINRCTDRNVFFFFYLETTPNHFVPSLWFNSVNSTYAL